MYGTHQVAMNAHVAICIAALVSTPLARGELVEAEMWYSAEGKVVKKVRAAPQGPAATRVHLPDWEPAWIHRERSRESRTPISIISGRRYGPRNCHGTTFSGYAGRYFHSRGWGDGITGYQRGRSGRLRWRVSYCRPGFVLRVTR